MLDEIKTSLSLFLLIPLVALTGIGFSLKFRFVQVVYALQAWRFFLGDRKAGSKGMSSFGAVAAVLGGNLGTGNISGTAVALSAGGPGALFWMWVMAIFGAILKFVGTTLGVLYRQRVANGGYVGGPMYYLAKGLGMTNTAKFYCILTIFAGLTVGNLVQMHSLSLPFTKAGIPPLVTGIGMAIIVAGVIFGGLKRFSHIVTIVVPFKAVAYVTACVIILCLNLDKLIPAIQLVVNAAFAPSALVGGVAGYTILQGLQAGFDRGLFAADVGVGIDAIVHSSVESKSSLTEHALTQGLISTISPMIVMIVCSLTGLVLIMTDTWLIPGLESTNLCVEAFRRGFSSNIAGHIITVTLFFFAFTTILTWSYCADKAVEYLFSDKMIRPFQWLFVLFIPLGTLLHVNLVWTTADIFMNLMLIINMIGLVGLYREVSLLYQTPERKRLFLASN